MLILYKLSYIDKFTINQKILIDLTNLEIEFIVLNMQIIR